MKAAHGMITLAADKLECHPDTIGNYSKRYPAVADAVRRERSRVVDYAEIKLFAAMQEGAPWAILKILNTLGRDRGYAEVVRNENYDMSQYSDDELRDIAQGKTGRSRRA